MITDHKRDERYAKKYGFIDFQYFNVISMWTALAQANIRIGPFPANHMN